MKLVLSASAFHVTSITGYSILPLALTQLKNIHSYHRVHLHVFTSLTMIFNLFRSYPQIHFLFNFVPPKFLVHNSNYTYSII